MTHIVAGWAATFETEPRPDSSDNRPSDESETSKDAGEFLPEQLLLLGHVALVLMAATGLFKRFDCIGKWNEIMAVACVVAYTLMIARGLFLILILV